MHDDGEDLGMPEKIRLLRVGALTLWALAIAVVIWGSVGYRHHGVGSIGVVIALIALAIDLRRLTIASVQRVIRAMSLYVDDVQPPR